MFGNFFIEKCYKHYELEGGAGVGYQKTLRTHRTWVERVAQNRKYVHKEKRASKRQRWVLYILLGRPLMVTLTHFVPIFSFNTP